MFIMRCRRIRKRSGILLLCLLAFSCLVYIFFLHLANAIINSLKDPHRTVEQHQQQQLHLNNNKNGINVIVAHYIGSGNIFGNYTKDVLNKNYFSPIDGEGDDGQPVIIPPRELLKMQHQFQINRYNLLASDRIPLNRTLPDVRKKQCLIKNYNTTTLPNTSIIIVFHNEAWSVLLRTVWSVINRSPHHLIKEILLVDDASTRDFLAKPLEDYVAKLPIVTKVLRLNQRQGLVPARLLGAKYATGKILTFLDAHCECTIGWLEPLLYQVKQNHNVAACPVIDIISDDTFGYVKSFELHWGAFNWQLHFRWYLLGAKQLNKRKENLIAPFETPAMAGGLFSIDREYFFQIGSYDEKMKIWGGDNLEMSFRLWQCGGRIEIIPCSHVGHLFRKSSPYTFPGGVNEILKINLGRTALVWMDEWAHFFFKFNSQQHSEDIIMENEFLNFDNLSDRLKLRQQLKCNTFDWYLRNIWVENFFPAFDRFFGRIILINSDNDLLKKYQQILSNFDIKNNLNWFSQIEYFNKNILKFNNMFNIDDKDSLSIWNNKLCLLPSPSSGVYGSSLNLPYGQAILNNCTNQRNVTTTTNEMFVIKSNGQIMTNEGVCLDAVDKFAAAVRIVTCANTPRQLWFYNMKTKQISQQKNEFNLCVTATKLHNDMASQNSDTNNNNNNNNNNNLLSINWNLTMTTCNSYNILQKWTLIPVEWTMPKR